MLTDTLQILILIFCSIDMDNLDREMLVQPSEPYRRRGFSSLLLLDMALYLLCLLRGITAFKGITANNEKKTKNDSPFQVINSSSQLHFEFGGLIPFQDTR